MFPRNNVTKGWVMGPKVGQRGHGGILCKDPGSASSQVSGQRTDAPLCQHELPYN